MLVEADEDSPIRCATVAYRRAGKLHVSVIVKARFAFVPGGPMVPVKPSSVSSHDRYHADDPARSVRRPAELSPLRERVDVLLRGSAYAPLQTAAPMCTASLLIASNDDTLLNKSLLVQGDRGDAGQPLPFRKMAICYERAVGGPDDPANPVGVGPEDANIFALGSALPGGFGPIAAAWPQRRNLLGGTSAEAMEHRIGELSDEVDPAYFQSAPMDQQLDWLHGDEWITLNGLHPSRPQLKTQLPGLLPAVALTQPGHREQDVPMHIDMLLLDSDRKTATVNWRGSFALDDERALQLGRVDVTLRKRAPELGDDWDEDEDIPIFVSSDANSFVDKTFAMVEDGSTEGGALPFQRADTARAPGPSSLATRQRIPTGTIEQVLPTARPALPFALSTTKVDHSSPAPAAAVGEATRIIAAPHLLGHEAALPFVQGAQPPPPSKDDDDDKDAAAPTSPGELGSGTLDADSLDALLSPAATPFEQVRIGHLAPAPACASETPAVARSDEEQPSPDPLLHTIDAPASAVLRPRKTLPFEGGDKALSELVARLPAVRVDSGTLDAQVGSDSGPLAPATPFERPESKPDPLTAEQAPATVAGAFIAAMAAVATDREKRAAGRLRRQRRIPH